MYVRRDTIEAAAKTRPAWYREMVYQLRDAAKDTPDQIWLSLFARERIAQRQQQNGKTYEFWLSALGLGDAVCGYFAACGLAEATGCPVVFRHGAHEWFSHVHHPLVTVKPHANIGPDAQPSYQEQIQSAESRKQYYCDALAKAFNLPRFTPKPPQIQRRSAA